MPIDGGMGTSGNRMGVYGDCLEERDGYKRQRDKLRKRVKDLEAQLQATTAAERERCLDILNVICGLHPDVAYLPTVIAIREEAGGE